MNDLSHIDQFQYRQLLEKGHSPEEAARILLESRRTIAQACQQLLDSLNTQEGTNACKKLLEELDAQGATDNDAGHGSDQG